MNSNYKLVLVLVLVLVLKIHSLISIQRDLFIFYLPSSCKLNSKDFLNLRMNVNYIIIDNLFHTH
jgi:hypothetical protein